MVTEAVKHILSHYESENPGSKNNLARILMHGKLGGTGKLVILPVDQGFEHGPLRSFGPNADSFDPHYHYRLAIDAGLSAYAAPLTMLEAGADSFAGEIPTILKMNSNNALNNNIPHQAITASIDDALRLGCSAVGVTIYPGSDSSLEMFEEVAAIAREAKSCGLAVVIWSYPRGGDLSKEGETAIDICAYAAHIATLLGAHIIKVKPPTAHIEKADNAKIIEGQKVGITTLKDRVALVKKSCFDGKRMVIFSGGGAKSETEILSDIEAINQGGGNGSIIGRNSFQRPRSEALELLNKICDIYKS